MATFVRIRNRGQSVQNLRNVVQYVLQEHKISYGEQSVASGVNCCAQTAYQEMMITKRMFRKVKGVFFFHFVQSFYKEDNIAPQEVNKLGLEFAKRQFPQYETLVATHSDTENFHNHLIVNSVSYITGKKLKQSPTSIRENRAVNDSICKAHGLSVLEPYVDSKKKGLSEAEYRVALNKESWKFTLMKAVEFAFLNSVDKRSFIQNMEYEGYQVYWTEKENHIAYTCPNGQKCWDRSLHDETYLKENMEKLFEYRRMHGFTENVPEPEKGWLSLIYPTNEEAQKYSKKLMPEYIHTSAKQKRRENLKRMAQEHTLPKEQNNNKRLHN